MARSADTDCESFGRAVIDLLEEAARLESFVGAARHADVPGQLQAKHDRKLVHHVASNALTPWQWVMFAEPARGGVRFLGAYVTRATSLQQAVLQAHLAGHCPGGHAEAVSLPPTLKIHNDYCDRLLTLEQAEALRDEIKRLRK